MSTTNQEDKEAFRKLDPKKHGRLYRFFNNALKSPYVLVAPALLAGLFISVYAIIYCIYLSFMKWNLLKNTKTFVGFYNYQYIFTDEMFLAALRNTVVFMIVTVFVGVALKVLIAIFLNKNKPIHNFVQTVMFTPHIIASVTIAIVFRYLMAPTGGLFNQILSFLHLPESQWYLGKDSALGSLILMSIWTGMGYGVLVSLSGLRSIPTYVYEAAKLDKSKPVNTLTHITVPLLSPTIFYLLVTTSVGAFTTYDIIDMMTSGGPDNATIMLTYYIYEQGIHFMNYGRAMAASVVLMLIVSGLTILNFKISANKIHYQ